MSPLFRFLPPVLASVALLGVPQLGLAQSAERQISLTFDDLPAQRAQALEPDRIDEILPALIETLTRREIPAIGFVNENKLLVDDRIDNARVALLERWLDAGLELGNHSFSHPDLHRTPLGDYLDDIARGEAVTRPLAEARSMPYRYFRHPMLHTGTDLETKRAVERFLADRDLAIAPVTIDNSEWIFARAYDEALDRGDASLQGRVGTAYVDYMESMAAYYEGQSRVLFEREIPQILLLHANSLNAHCLVALVERLAGRGYAFVSLDAALTDPAYDSTDTYTGPGGITWLHRWALTRAVDRSIFAGEPTTPDWVQDLAGFRE